MPIRNNILEAIGHTPLVALQRITAGLNRQILVKVEALNPGGSIKTRTALNMVEDAESKGLLNKDSIIVEFTSGNQGIGLALVAAVKGYKCTIVMPSCMSEERKRIMATYGAEIILTPVGSNITETFSFAKAKVKELLASDSRYVLAGQFVNPANCNIHHDCTAQEIIDDLGDIIPAAFLAAVGTGGHGHRCR